MTTTKLNRIRVAGFRSLRDVSLELTPVTVLIGPNGAGKSNLLWTLEMVRMLATTEAKFVITNQNVPLQVKGGFPCPSAVQAKLNGSWEVLDTSNANALLTIDP